jgi:hypothetical protein
MGGCPSADTVRHDSDAERNTYGGARATGGQHRAVETGGQQQQPQHLQHLQVGGPDSARLSRLGTPNLGGPSTRPNGLHVAPPETPGDDGRPRHSGSGPHPDIIQLPGDGTSSVEAQQAAAKFLEREKARISIPETPTSTQASIYKHSCPLCMEYFREIWKAACCSNTVCILCALAHVRQRSSNPAVSTWHSLPENESLPGVACPICNSDDVRFSRVGEKDKARSYQESPHTRDLFAAMEARKRFEIGVSVASVHQPSLRVMMGKTQRDLGEDRRQSGSETASMRAVRNHPVADLRRGSSDPSVEDIHGGADASSAHHSLLGDRTPEDEHEFEIEHDEDVVQPALSGATMARQHPVGGAPAASVASSSSAAASSSSARPASSRTVPRAPAQNQYALPPRPTTSSNSGAAAIAAQLSVGATSSSDPPRPVSRPESAPSSARPDSSSPPVVASDNAAIAASSADPAATVTSARRASTPTVDVQGRVLPLVPPSAASAIPNSASSSSSSVPSSQQLLAPDRGRSSGGARTVDRLHSAETKRLAQGGWTPVAEDASSSSSSASSASVSTGRKPASVRVHTSMQDETKEAEALFLPSPHAKELRQSSTNSASGPGSAYRTFFTGTESPAVSGTAEATPVAHDAAIVMLEEVPSISSAISLNPSLLQVPASCHTTQPISSSNDLLEQSFSFDGASASMMDASMGEMEATAAVHPMTLTTTTAQPTPTET